MFGRTRSSKEYSVSAVCIAIVLTCMAASCASSNSVRYQSPEAQQPQSPALGDPGGLAGPSVAQEKNEASADQSEDVRLTVDDLLSKCPSAAEIQGIDAALDLSFESDPTKEQRVCTVGATASNLSRLQTRTYQTLLIMRNLKFSHPLPWTDQSLYDWFIGNIHGIRFRDDIDANFCCEPTGIINVQARKYQARAAVLTDRWLDPRSGTGAESLLLLLVHEARHAQAGPHRCEDTSDVLIRYKDTDVAELGAWGVQYQLLRWLVEYSNPRFLEAPGADPAYYLLEMGRQADSARKQFFCD